ncbi:TANC1, partial [Symbiodinium sp. CCMP2456]
GLGRPTELTALCLAFDHLVDDYTSQLLVSIVEENEQHMEEILGKAQNPNVTFTSFSFRGLTPLSAASRNGQASMLLLLLQARADVNAADQQGQVPLQLAAANGHTE